MNDRDCPSHTANGRRSPPRGALTERPCPFVRAPPTSVMRDAVHSSEQQGVNTGRSRCCWRVFIKRDFDHRSSFAGLGVVGPITVVATLLLRLVLAHNLDALRRRPHLRTDRRASLPSCSGHASNHPAVWRLSRAMRTRAMVILGGRRRCLSPVPEWSTRRALHVMRGPGCRPASPGHRPSCVRRQR